MKKILSACVCAIVLSIPASADIARIEMGAGAWAQTPSGSASYNAIANATGKDVLNEDKDTSPYVWLLLKHPLPVIPNIRLEYTKVSETGKATGQWGNTASTTITGTSNSSLDMTQYDIIAYYNLLDNTFWMTLDLGVDLKIVDIDYSIAPATPFSGYSYSKSFALPMAYLRTRVEIPATNIGLEADVKYISNGSSTIYDARAKVDYTLDMFPVIQPALEVGYRTQKIKVDESNSDIKTDIDFSGFYAGLMLRF